MATNWQTADAEDQRLNTELARAQEYLGQRTSLLESAEQQFDGLKNEDNWNTIQGFKSDVKGATQSVITARAALENFRKKRYAPKPQSISASYWDEAPPVQPKESPKPPKPPSQSSGGPGCLLGGLAMLALLILGSIFVFRFGMNTQSQVDALPPGVAACFGIGPINADERMNLGVFPCGLLPAAIPIPTPTATPQATATPEPTPVPTPTATPTPQPTASPAISPSPAPTPSIKPDFPGVCTVQPGPDGIKLDGAINLVSVFNTGSWIHFQFFATGSGEPERDTLIPASEADRSFSKPMSGTAFYYVQSCTEDQALADVQKTAAIRQADPTVRSDGFVDLQLSGIYN